MSRPILALLSLGLAAVAVARPGPMDELAIEDSLRHVPPRLRYYWLRDRGLEDWYSPAAAPDSQGLSCVGRWSFGPAYDVDGRILPGDTLLALARGSGVSLVRFSRLGGLTLEVLADVNCDRLTGQVLIRDTLLYVASYGLEVYGISNPRHPLRHARLETSLLGFDVVDTLVYVTTYDSFKVYSAADPANLRLVGACRDSGAAVSVAGGTAVLGGSNSIHLLDVTDPTNPHRVGQYPGWALAVAARNTICCITFGNPSEPSEQWFEILDISAPGSPRRLGRLDDAGGNDICLDGPVAFLSGFYTGGHEFRILDISDSTAPSAVGTCATLSDNYGVWGTLAGGAAQVADNYGGMAMIDIRTPSQPEVDSVALRVGYTMDVSIEDSLCYVASDGAGLKVLDITDPSAPEWIGDLDTAHKNLSTLTLVARDSFVFTCWRQPYLRSVDVTDPTSPRMAGACAVTARPEDLALRDSFLYVAEDDLFQVVNVARPREPEVVGTCGLPERTRGLFVRDTFAFVAQGYTGLIILSIAQPDAPRELGRYLSVRSTHGVWVEDTIAYIAEFDSGLTVVSVADPQSCRKLGSHLTPAWAYDVLVVDSVAYMACRDGIRAFEVRDPTQPVEVGFYSTPYLAWRLAYDAPHLYVACYDAGVCLFEQCSTGVAEGSPARNREEGAVEVLPNPARASVVVRAGRLTAPGRLTVRDVTGRRVRGVRLCAGPVAQSVRLDVGGLPAGLYFVEVASAGSVKRGRLVKQR